MVINFMPIILAVDSVKAHQKRGKSATLCHKPEVHLPGNWEDAELLHPVQQEAVLWIK